MRKLVLTSGGPPNEAFSGSYFGLIAQWNGLRRPPPTPRHVRPRALGGSRWVGQIVRFSISRLG